MRIALFVFIFASLALSGCAALDPARVPTSQDLAGIADWSVTMKPIVVEDADGKKG